MLQNRAQVLVALFAPSGIAKSGTAEIPLIGRIARALEVCEDDCYASYRCVDDRIVFRSDRTTEF